MTLLRAAILILSLGPITLPLAAFADDEEEVVVVKRPKKIAKIPPLEQPLNPPSPSPLPGPQPSPQPIPAPPGPLPGPAPQPAPAPAGTGLAGGVMREKLGPEGFRNFVNNLQEQFAAPAQQQGARGGCGTNFRCQDAWFDRAGEPRPDTPMVRPQQPEARQAGFTPPSREISQGTLRAYGGQPGGGVVLEGTARGLTLAEEVGYDRQFNALVLDGQAVYFIRIPPATFAELCRALARDRKVGVSLGQRRIVYGAMPKDSDLAFDLTLADRFLGDIVFARDDWAAGYRFAGRYAPRKHVGPIGNMAVFFRFRDYAFEVQGREVVPTRGAMDVSLVPLSNQQAADGNLLPDFDAIDARNISPQFEANARHLADNISHYRREQIVQRTFVYGEVASLLRWLRREGVDLDELAAQVD